MIAKRQHSQVFDSACITTGAEGEKRKRGHVKIKMFKSILLLIFNQLVYCLFAISIIMKRRSEISYKSTAKEIRPFAIADVLV